VLSVELISNIQGHSTLPKKASRKVGHIAFCWKTASLKIGDIAFYGKAVPDFWGHSTSQFIYLPKQKHQTKKMDTFFHLVSFGILTKTFVYICILNVVRCLYVHPSQPQIRPTHQYRQD